MCTNKNYHNHGRFPAYNCCAFITSTTFNLLAHRLPIPIRVSTPANHYCQPKSILAKYYAHVASNEELYAPIIGYLYGDGH